MADTGDVDTLKRRGRRRLVGAIALVLAAVIVLPMVFDPEPRQTPTTVNIRIPREDAGTFAPKGAPRPPTPAPARPTEADRPAAGSQQPAGAAAASKVTQEPRQSAKPAEQAVAKPPADRERERAEAALSNAEYMVPVAALSSADRVKALTGKLASAKIPYYTERVSTVSGQVTRVRAGPFASREEADRARVRIERLGLKPGSVALRSE
jgi:DedD protein